MDDQLNQIVQIISTGGALAVLVAWVRSLQADIAALRKQLEDAQDKLEKSYQTQVEWQRYERMKDLPREDTRPIRPRWQDESHPAARIEE